MKSIEKLKELFDPVFTSCDVKLYDMNWHGSGNNLTLEVAITKKDGTMDLDTCALVSEQLSALLDQYEDTNSPYTLDVCSPGAEREIKDLNELEELKDTYVFVRLIHPIQKKVEFTGTLHPMGNQEYELTYRDKAVSKKITFTREDINFIRLAVKI